MTLDTYSHAVPAMEEEAADKIAGLGVSTLCWTIEKQISIAEARNFPVPGGNPGPAAEIVHQILLRQGVRVMLRKGLAAAAVLVCIAVFVPGAAQGVFPALVGSAALSDGSALAVSVTPFGGEVQLTFGPALHTGNDASQARAGDVYCLEHTTNGTSHLWHMTAYDPRGVVVYITVDDSPGTSVDFASASSLPDDDVACSAPAVAPAVVAGTFSTQTEP